jgi:outer membrane lipoprotein LolB
VGRSWACNARAAALAAQLIAALAVAGCATREAAVERSTETLSGRLSIQVGASPEQQARGFAAAFDLTGTGEQGQLQLNSPLGVTLASAQWNAGEARLVTPSGARRFADLETLSREALGESLPLRALHDWLHGRPWPGAPSQALATNAPGFDQLDWRIDLSRFHEGWVSADRRTSPVVMLRVRLDTAP